MSAEFRSLVELALSAPLVNPRLIMSCADEDRELGDLHGYSNDVDSLVKAFESQGDCLLELVSDDQSQWRTKSGIVTWGAFSCMDPCVPEELVVDHTDNEVMTKIYDAWMLTVS